jgi:uncharacterized integral membrane protein
LIDIAASSTSSPVEGGERPMTRRRAALGLALVALAALFVFALYNRGQPIAFTFGFWRWRVDAVVAVYVGIGLGLLAMFLLGLPGDLAARAENARLARRVRQLERERGGD